MQNGWERQQRTGRTATFAGREDGPFAEHLISVTVVGDGPGHDVLVDVRVVPLAHPQYPSQVHSASVYGWPGAEPPLRVAIAEVSANVYALAVSPPTTEVTRG